MSVTNIKSPLIALKPGASLNAEAANTASCSENAACSDTFELFKTQSPATSVVKKSAQTKAEPKVPRHVLLTAAVLAVGVVLALPVAAVVGVVVGIGALVGYIYSKREAISNYCKEVALAS